MSFPGRRGSEGTKKKINFTSVLLVLLILATVFVIVTRFMGVNLPSKSVPEISGAGGIKLPFSLPASWQNFFNRLTPVLLTFYVILVIYCFGVITEAKSRTDIRDVIGSVCPLALYLSTIFAFLRQPNWAVVVIMTTYVIPFVMSITGPTGVDWSTWEDAFSFTFVIGSLTYGLGALNTFLKVTSGSPWYNIITLLSMMIRVGKVDTLLEILGYLFLVTAMFYSTKIQDEEKKKIFISLLAGAGICYTLGFFNHLINVTEPIPQARLSLFSYLAFTVAFILQLGELLKTGKFRQALVFYYGGALVFYGLNKFFGVTLPISALVGFAVAMGLGYAGQERKLVEVVRPGETGRTFPSEVIKTYALVVMFMLWALPLTYH